MAYSSVIVKEDQGTREVYFYLCQTQGCGAVINPEFPVSLKTPSPVHCKDCKTAVARKEIEEDYKLNNK